MQQSLRLQAWGYLCWRDTGNNGGDVVGASLLVAALDEALHAFLRAGVLSVSGENLARRSSEAMRKATHRSEVTVPLAAELFSFSRLVIERLQRATIRSTLDEF